MAFNKVQALQEAQRTLAQGKLSQAIREYLNIIENDPSDLSLLNAVGDICVRDNNMAEALRLFRRLAEAYVREGFILRAIAIYKKIIKLDPAAVEPMLKLAELYTNQSLSREARDLYAQALAICQRDNQKERAIEVMRKIVSSDPTNMAHLLRLAECCLAVGRTGEALNAYLDGAEAALRQGDTSSATVALDQAATINPLAPRVDELRRQLSPETETEPVSPEVSAGPITPEVAAEPVSPQVAAEPAAPEAVEEPVSPEVAAEPISPEAAVAPAGPEAAAGPISAEAPGEGAGVPQAEELPEQLRVEPAAEVELEPLAVEAAPEAAPVEKEPAPAQLLREPEEFDLSGEWEAVAASRSYPAEVEAPKVDLEEASAEIDFYLNYGLTEEARKTITRLEASFPGNPLVAEFRRRLEAPASAEPLVGAVETVEVSVGSAEMVEPSARPADTVRNPLDDLARDLESSWAGMESAPEKRGLAASEHVTMPDFAVSLGALLGELGSEPSGASPEDPQTHYELGVAFREMGLIEEAIGEFQKVVRRTRGGSYPPQYLASCSLLGLCFMDRKLPKLAANWYVRALECPGLDPEAALALEYDLGTAFEQAGNLEAARERFLDVYSQNVDYRDVADKIRQLAGKP